MNLNIWVVNECLIRKMNGNQNWFRLDLVARWADDSQDKIENILNDSEQLNGTALKM